MAGLSKEERALERERERLYRKQKKEEAAAAAAKEVGWEGRAGGMELRLPAMSVSVSAEVGERPGSQTRGGGGMARSAPQLLGNSSIDAGLANNPLLPRTIGR